MTRHRRQPSKQSLAQACSKRCVRPVVFAACSPASIAAFFVLFFLLCLCSASLGTFGFPRLGILQEGYDAQPAPERARAAYLAALENARLSLARRSRPLPDGDCVECASGARVAKKRETASATLRRKIETRKRSRQRRSHPSARPVWLSDRSCRYIPTRRLGMGMDCPRPLETPCEYAIGAFGSGPLA